MRRSLRNDNLFKLFMIKYTIKSNQVKPDEQLQSDRTREEQHHARQTEREDR